MIKGIGLQNTHCHNKHQFLPVTRTESQAACPPCATQQAFLPRTPWHHVSFILKAALLAPTLSSLLHPRRGLRHCGFSKLHPLVQWNKSTHYTFLTYPFHSEAEVLLYGSRFVCVCLVFMKNTVFGERFNWLLFKSFHKYRQDWEKALY